MSICRGASVVSYVSRAVDDLDRSDDASGTKAVPGAGADRGRFVSLAPRRTRQTVQPQLEPDSRSDHSLAAALIASSQVRFCFGCPDAIPGLRMEETLGRALDRR
jgi:hypothetical protein